MTRTRLKREWIVMAVAAVTGVAGVAGCGSKDQPAATAGSAQGSGGSGAGGSSEAKADPAAPAEPAAGSNAAAGSGSAAGADDDDGPKPAPMPKVQAACLPPPPPPDAGPDAGYQYRFGRTGGKLVLCGSNADNVVFGCWNVDPKGALSARPVAAIPGASAAMVLEKNCYEGLCVPAPPRDEEWGALRVAMHPDGKRAAALHGESVTLFDVASKKATLTFPLRKGDDAVAKHEITNAPVDLWFVGETVFVHGIDAGPASALFPYSVQGKAIGPAYWGFYLGGAAMDEDKLVLVEDALEKLTILDGRLKAARSIKRKLPRSPCKDGERDPELSVPEDYEPGADKCFDYQVKHFLPYRGAQLVTEGKGYIGLVDTSLVTVDARLAETGRVKLAQCAN